MTKRHKVFSTHKPATKSDLTFTLGKETYTCYDEIQGACILDFIAAADESASKAGARILPFFDDVLSPAELERFNKQIKSPDEIIEMETLSEIVAWLIGEYTSRPTKASEKSDAGSSSTGSGLKEITPPEE